MAGNQGNNRIVWEDWQLRFLHDHWQHMTAQQLSDKLGIKRTKVREKKYELGYYSLILEYWTDEQIDFLKKHYRKIGDTELAQLFNERWHKNKGWTKKHIEKKRRYLGLKRSDRQKEAIKKREVKKGTYREANKKNWMGRAASDGDTRIWNVAGNPVQVIKVNGVWVHHARYLYKTLHGRIKKGVVIRLKDGNPYNVVPENLIAVTRATHAAYNSKSRHDIEVQRQKAKNKLRYQIDLITKIKKVYEKQNERFKQSSLHTAGKVE